MRQLASQSDSLLDSLLLNLRTSPGSDDDRQDLADLMQRIDLMNAKQRRIIGGVVAMPQAFDYDGAARRWIDQHQ